VLGTGKTYIDKYFVTVLSLFGKHRNFVDVLRCLSLAASTDTSLRTNGIEDIYDPKSKGLEWPCRYITNVRYTKNLNDKIKHNVNLTLMNNQDLIIFKSENRIDLFASNIGHLTKLEYRIRRLEIG